MGELWTDRELQAALEVYLYAKRLEQSGIRIPEQQLVDALRSGTLHRRNSASIRYRLRNISAVLQKYGNSTIGSFPPATKVGSGVEARLRTMLSNAAFGAPLRVQPPRRSYKSRNEDALAALQELADALHEVDLRTIGLGHNNPPEEIEPGTFRGDLRRAITAIEQLRDELLLPKPNEDVVRDTSVRIAQSGVGWAAWFGARGTKAADTAIATVIPLALLGLAALAFKALTAVAQLLPHLF